MCLNGLSKHLCEGCSGHQASHGSQTIYHLAHLSTIVLTHKCELYDLVVANSVYKGCDIGTPGSKNVRLVLTQTQWRQQLWFATANLSIAQWLCTSKRLPFLKLLLCSSVGQTMSTTVFQAKDNILDISCCSATQSPVVHNIQVHKSWDVTLIIHCFPHPHNYPYH